jgi:hypothetical protein
VFGKQLPNIQASSGSAIRLCTDLRKASTAGDVKVRSPTSGRFDKKAVSSAQAGAHGDASSADPPTIPAFSNDLLSRVAMLDSTIVLSA